jgi:hypothetical protein
MKLANIKKQLLNEGAERRIPSHYIEWSSLIPRDSHTSTGASRAMYRVLVVKLTEKINEFYRENNVNAVLLPPGKSGQDLRDMFWSDDRK